SCGALRRLLSASHTTSRSLRRCGGSGGSASGVMEQRTAPRRSAPDRRNGMTLRFVVPLGVLVAVALCAGWFLTGGVPSRAAADDAGTITGQVAWCAPLPGPYAVAPGAEGGSGSGT